MSNYWIFKVKADSDGEYSLTGLQIFEHRMQDKAWGIREQTENGRKTPNTALLAENDKVLFYLCGEEGYCFLGTGILKTGFGAKLESVFHKEHLDLITGAFLSKVEPWAIRLPLETLRGKVHFVPVSENYGCYIQGSITRISEKDYKTVIQEHNQINCLGNKQH